MCHWSEAIADASPGGMHMSSVTKYANTRPHCNILRPHLFFDMHQCRVYFDKGLYGVCIPTRGRPMNGCPVMLRRGRTRLHLETEDISHLVRESHITSFL